MSAEVLKEFLVKLGWQNDDAAYRRFGESIASATKGVLALGVALKAAAITATAVVHRISLGFEALAYSTSRVNASASNINAFKYAISQLGGTADGAMASIEAFSRKLRESPGQEAWLKSWGVNTRDAQGRMRDTTALMTDLLKSQKFQSQPEYLRLHLAEFAGIDEKTYRAMMLDVSRFTSEYKAKMRAAGLDPDKASEDAKKFSQAWRSAAMSFDIIRDRVAMAFAGPLGDKFQQFINFLDRNSAKIADGLVTIGKALMTAATWIAEVVIKFGEWAAKADPWIEKNFGITNGFEKLAAVLLLLSVTRIPALLASIVGLTGSGAFKALFGLLGGLGMIGTAALGAAVVGGGIAAMGTPGGAATIRDMGNEARESIRQGGGRWNRFKSAIGLGPAQGSAKPGTRTQMMGWAMDELRKLGVPEANLRAAAAHLVGQADMESGLDPTKSHDGGTGYGIYGARLERRAMMFEWLKANGYPLNSAEGQMRYMAREAMLGNKQRSFPKTRRILMGATPEGMNRESWGITHEFEAPRVDNDRSGAVWQAYRAGERAGQSKITPPTPIAPRAAAPKSPVAPWAGGLAPLNPAGPLGASLTPSSSTTIINSKNTFNVDGARDPGATARSIAGIQTSVHADIVRNTQGAAH